MPNPEQSCRSCRWWDKPLIASLQAKRRPCLWPWPPMPALPEAVIEHPDFTWPVASVWTAADEGQTCPTWEQRS